jgi:hypothetical protein
LDGRKGVRVVGFSELLVFLDLLGGYMGEYLGVGAGWQRLCAGFVLLGESQASWYFRIGSVAGAGLRSWLIFPYFSLSILASLYHGLNSGQCYGLLPLLYPYFSICLDLLLGDCISDMVLRREVLVGLAMSRICFAWAQPGCLFWRLHFAAHSPCSSIVLGKLAGSGLAKHSGNTWERGVQSVVLFVGFVPNVGLRWSVCELVRVASFWGAGRQVVFLSTFVVLLRGLLCDMCGVGRVGLAPPPSCLSGFGGFPWPYLHRLFSGF